MIKYKPYTHHNISNSILETLFNLYFFIFSQTLGIVHEAGHGICYILHCPKFITTLNGTLFQLLFPIIIAIYYYKKNNKFASYIAIFFIGFSLSYTAWYISTSYQGALVSANKSFLGNEGYHDFYYILSSLTILKYYKVISTVLKILSYLIMLLSLLLIFIETL